MCKMTQKAIATTTTKGPDSLEALLSMAGNLNSSSSSLTSSIASPQETNTKRRRVEKRSRNQRRARFAEDDEGNVLCQTHMIERCDDLGADPQELWWTSDEMEEIAWETKNIIKFFQQNKQYIQALSSLYKSEKTCHLETNFDVLVMADRARGLESHIVQRVTQGLVDNHLDSVLDAYYDGKGSVRKMSKVASFLSVRFAANMGTFDEQEAGVVYALSRRAILRNMASMR